MQQQTNVPGVISLTLSIMSIFFMCCFGVGLLFGIPAFILGLVGISKKNMPTGTAIAGLIVSIVGCIMSTLTILYWMIIGGASLGIMGIAS
ncbi:MAG: hypothetical protein K2H41_14060 [Acetatifactor sp.]|nr:hypothetical protein [Acetatifactor sp.]